MTNTVTETARVHVGGHEGSHYASGSRAYNYGVGTYSGDAEQWGIAATPSNVIPFRLIEVSASATYFLSLGEQSAIARALLRSVHRKAGVLRR